MARIYQLFLITFAVLLLLPSLSGLVKVPRKLKLGGVIMEPGLTPISKETFLDGTLQNNLEERFKRKTAAWPWLVRSDNQLNLLLFEQLSSNYDAAVVLGQGNVLFERSYLADFNRARKLGSEKAAGVIQNLSLLQEKLAAHGIRFLLVLSPSKLEFEPQIVPPRYVVRGRGKRQNAAQILLPRLRARGINVFDTHAFLKEAQRGLESPFFAPGGTHWNEFAACLAGAEILQRIGTLAGAKTAQISCANQGIRKAPTADAIDLVRLANLWSGEPFSRPGLKLVRQIRSPGEYHPRVLWEGTSFTFELMRTFGRVKPFAVFDFYYYFNRRYTLPLKHSEPLELDQPGLRQELLSRDVVVLEINESVLDEVGHGFLERALAVL